MRVPNIQFKTVWRHWAVAEASVYDLCIVIQSLTVYKCSLFSVLSHFFSCVDLSFPFFPTLLSLPSIAHVLWLVLTSQGSPDGNVMASVGPPMTNLNLKVPPSPLWGQASWSSLLRKSSSLYFCHAYGRCESILSLPPSFPTCLSLVWAAFLLGLKAFWGKSSHFVHLLQKAAQSWSTMRGTLALRC